MRPAACYGPKHVSMRPDVLDRKQGRAARPGPAGRNGQQPIGLSRPRRHLDLVEAEQKKSNCRAPRTTSAFGWLGADVTK